MRLCHRVATAAGASALALTTLGGGLSLARSKPAASAAAQRSDIVGHVIAGYQGWFAEPGDGSPVGNLPPGKGNYHDNYETYPDLREFPDREQFATPRPWEALPNGNPARLFASDRDVTADLHARWMRQYGIDVAAIQRFGEVSREPTQAAQKNDLTRRLGRACARHGVHFYIEYDSSGSGGGNWGPDFVQGIENDWNRFAVGQKIVTSSAYARQNGRPVVELWGIGLNGNHIATDPSRWRELVRWFHRQGVYVIAGTPTYWRTGDRDALPGFEGVYAACDAINPWIVGRIGTDAGADEYARGTLVPDRDWCRARHIAYIPCIYPGTSFYNSNGKNRNGIPRRNGALMWRQFVNLRQAGISTCFISMFDEYNEATAIAKTAEDASMVPAGHWFLTLDADGADLSSDYYLRLTADGARMLRGAAPLVWTAPTPHRDDLFFTSFEDGQPLPLPLSPAPPATTGNIVTDRAQRGSHSLRFAGMAPHAGVTGAIARKLFDFHERPPVIGRNTLLYYWLAPQNENGRYVALDLHFTDGSTLSQIARVRDVNGRPLAASAGHGGGIPLNGWTCITARLGEAAAGKKLASLWAVYDRPGAADGAFAAYLDDIEITR